MSDAPNAQSVPPPHSLPRGIADAYVDALVVLDPITGTMLGDRGSHGALPDFSPDGADQIAALAKDTLRRLTETGQLPGTGTAMGADGNSNSTGAGSCADSAIERNCGRLLRERLTAELAVHEADEGLRALSNIRSPVHRVRRRSP